LIYLGDINGHVFTDTCDGVGLWGDVINQMLEFCGGDVKQMAITLNTTTGYHLFHISSE
jgi:hypothetical protein